ncbi:hypothetical protein CDD83_8770 [Cordyceps sp. RAO-2017]|nr:hypothetical protein CDD83_8770 [Cordyceps sp. RAO-2017]
MNEWLANATGRQTAHPLADPGPALPNIRPTSWAYHDGRRRHPAALACAGPIVPADFARAHGSSRPSTGLTRRLPTDASPGGDVVASHHLVPPSLSSSPAPPPPSLPRSRSPKAAAGTTGASHGYLLRTPLAALVQRFPLPPACHSSGPPPLCPDSPSASPPRRHRMQASRPSSHRTDA